MIPRQILIVQSLALVKTLPATPEQVQQELTLLLTLGGPLMVTKGTAMPETSQVYLRARDLCQRVGDPQQLFAALQGLRGCYLGRVEFETAHEVGTQLLTLAQRLEDSAYLLQAHHALGETWTFSGQLILAREHYEQAIALYNRQQHHALAFQSGFDLGVTCLAFVAHLLWYLGYPDQALRRIQEAFTLGQELSHPYSLATVLSWAAWLHLFRREASATQTQAEAAMSLATEYGFPLWLSLGAQARGWALAEQGQAEEGLTPIGARIRLAAPRSSIVMRREAPPRSC